MHSREYLSNITRTNCYKFDFCQKKNAFLQYLCGKCQNIEHKLCQHIECNQNYKQLNHLSDYTICSISTKDMICDKSMFHFTREMKNSSTTENIFRKKYILRNILKKITCRIEIISCDKRQNICSKH